MGFHVEFRNQHGIMESQDLELAAAVKLLDKLERGGAEILAIVSPSGEQWGADEARRYFQSAPLS
jgi:hypothetical protein